MPIKELIALGLLSVATIAANGGPWNLRENLLKAQIKMLHKVGRTSNWGDPLIWHSDSQKIKLRPKKKLAAKGLDH